MIRLILFLLLLPSFASATDVKFLSWNAYMLPSPIKKSVQKVRTHVIGQQLAHSDYDILFFQEAFMGSFRKSLTERLGTEYPYSYYLKKRRIFSIFGSGVFVMSRHPFRVLDKIRYKKCEGADCFSDKGAPLIEMDLPNGKTVQFVPTHLNAGKKNELIRQAQVKQIATLLAKHRKDGVPQVVLGDLNIEADTPEYYNALDRVEMQPVQMIGEVRTTNSVMNECFKTGTNKKWIDHIWTDSYARAESTLEVKVFGFEYRGRKCASSDHHAIEGQLSFH